MHIYRIWCEWDYGQRDFVFSSKEKGYDWFNRVVLDTEGEKWPYLLGFSGANPKEAWKEIQAAGLAGIIELELDP